MKCHACFNNYKKNELKIYSSRSYCLNCLDGVLESEGKTLKDGNITDIRVTDAKVTKNEPHIVAGFVSFAILKLLLFLSTLFMESLKIPSNTLIFMGNLKIPSNTPIVTYILMLLMLIVSGGCFGILVSLMFLKIRRFIPFKNIYLQALLFFIFINAIITIISMQNIILTDLMLSTVFSAIVSIIYVSLYLKLTALSSSQGK
jgi:hypothetical protein